MTVTGPEIIDGWHYGYPPVLLAVNAWRAVQTGIELRAQQHAPERTRYCAVEWVVMGETGRQRETWRPWREPFPVWGVSVYVRARPVRRRPLGMERHGTGQWT